MVNLANLDSLNGDLGSQRGFSTNELRCTRKTAGWAAAADIRDAGNMKSIGLQASLLLEILLMKTYPLNESRCTRRAVIRLSQCCAVQTAPDGCAACLARKWR